MPTEIDNRRLPKKWQSLKDQVAILESRGMIFEDKSKAEYVLSQVNYYRLSGYWYPFRIMLLDNSRSDDFVENIVNLR